MKLNTKPAPVYTTEGAKATKINSELSLRRSVLSCLLWEDSFYQDGTSIAERIASLVPLVKAEKVANIAIEARTAQKLRHVPLLLAREMVKYEEHRQYVADVLFNIIQRPDELTEFLSIYWKDGKCPIANQIKKGLARAFTKFDEYSLAKYNQQNEIKLRDVLFLCHAKPVDSKQEKLWKRLIDNQLATPDTWEVELSKSQDQKASWERLLKENKLKALALLRNLRNMIIADVNENLITKALNTCNVEKVLPFRFITAARYAPKFENQLEKLMLSCLQDFPKISEKTALIVDISGSMKRPLSNKSELSRMDAANGLAILTREIFSDIDIYSFSNDCILVPARHGFALSDAIKTSQPHKNTYLNTALQKVDGKYDRVIVITDEQSQETVSTIPAKKNYLINISCEKNGVGYGNWIHIDGWSESIVQYIVELENSYE